MQLLKYRNTILIVAVLLTALFLFTDLFRKLYTLNFDIVKSIKSSSSLQSSSSPAYNVEDMEKWKNFLLMKSVPAGQFGHF
jgi:hypothetical protein